MFVEVGEAFLCGEAAAATTGFFAAGGAGCSPGPSDAAAAAAETAPRREEEGRNSSDAAFLAWWRNSGSGDGSGDDDDACVACRPEVLAPAPPRVASVALLHLNSARSIVERKSGRFSGLILRLFLVVVGRL